MSTLLLANIILVIGAISGQYLIAQVDKRGFIIYFGVELSMIYIGYLSANYGLCVAAVMYFMMNIYSYLTWKKRGL